MSASDRAARRLQSERLVLEPLAPAHADELAPVLADAALYRFTGGEPEDAPGLRARYARWAAGRSPDGREEWRNWVVRERETAEAVGTVQATVRVDGPPAAELAWVIGVAHQGRGLATEAAGLMIAWLRSRGVARVCAHIHPGHEASMGVARAVGMHATGAVRDGEVRWESP